jgi:hypothetical protein
MSEIVYLKTACERCSGNIEYPFEMAGQSIECPHCHQTITLPSPFTASAPQPPPPIPHFPTLQLPLGGSAACSKDESNSSPFLSQNSGP